tara:strand:+ start:392 stop:1309 length:918 start_codon:yes stop_codon:yes gene_type:complete
MSEGIQDTPGYGTSDWEPDIDTLTGGLSSEDIASGFGLEPADFATYFEPYDNWRAKSAEEDSLNAFNDLENKNIFDKANSALKTEELNKQEGYASDDLASSLEANILNTSNAFGASMGQMIESQASGLIGGASIRAKKTMGSTIQDASNVAGNANDEGYGRTMDKIGSDKDSLAALDKFQADKFIDDQASLATDLAYKTRADKERYKSEIEDVLSDLSSEGAFDLEGSSTQDWITSIQNQNNHWATGDFKKSNGEYYSNEFLQWFSENQGSVDTGWTTTSRQEVAAAAKDYREGNLAGDSNAYGW